MENKRLINLVKDKIISGYSDEEIHNFLVQEGLSDEKIEEVLHLCLQKLHLEEEEVEKEEINNEDTHEHHNYHIPSYIPLPGAWWLLIQSFIILKENLVKVSVLALMWTATLIGATIGVLLLGLILSIIFSVLKVSSMLIMTLTFIVLIYFFILLFIPVCYFISVIRLISMQSKGAFDAYQYSIKRFFPIALTTALVIFSYLSAITLFVIIVTLMIFLGHPIIAVLIGSLMMMPLFAVLVWYSLTSVVMANDEQYYAKAIARSREYIKGHFFGFWVRAAFMSTITILILIVFAVIIPADENKKDKSFGETLSRKVFIPNKEAIFLKNNDVRMSNLNENFNYKIPFENFSEPNFIIDGNWVCNRYDQYDCVTYRKTKSGEISNQSAPFLNDYEKIKNTIAKKAKNYEESYNQIKADNFVCNRHNLYYCDKDGFPQIYGYPDDLSKEIKKLNAAITSDNKMVMSGDLPIADSNDLENKIFKSKGIGLDFIWDIIYFVIILPIFAIYFQILYVYLSRNKELPDHFTFSKKHKILFLILVFLPILIAISIVVFFGKIAAIMAMLK